ncbi:hypothetical protein ACTFIW_009043 [Dictyostelium discoideum]
MIKKISIILITLFIIQLTKSVSVNNKENNNNNNNNYFIDHYNYDLDIDLTSQQQSSSSSSDTPLEPPSCGELCVCLYTELNYQGLSYEYSIYSGKVDLPPSIRNNITSFVSNADVCFITYDPYVTIQIYTGEFLSNFGIVFGDILQTLAPGSCKDLPPNQF